MTTDQQNINWTRTTSDFRAEVREAYQTFHAALAQMSQPNHTLQAGIEILESLYGRDNIVSATEPQPQLMLNSKHLFKLYLGAQRNIDSATDPELKAYWRGQKELLHSLCSEHLSTEGKSRSHWIERLRIRFNRCFTRQKGLLQEA